MRPRLAALAPVAALSIIAGLASFAAPRPAAAAELLMVRQAGCSWCAQWDEDIGGIYAKTAEGRRAPLVQRDIADPAPPGVTLDMGVNFTPTFVLIEDGRELGRIEGYPGPDFFWGLMQRLLSKLPAEAAAAAASSVDES